MEETASSGGATIDLENKLSLDDTFQFACGPEVPCFTECCGKLELLLTPYDVLRLKKRLGMSSADFIDTHVIMRWKTPHGFPELLMKMDREQGKRCPFVTEAGCTLYEDRPGACRIYPLGRASTKHPAFDTQREFYFTVRENHCKGFEEPREWTVREWIADQGVETYNRLNDLLMELYMERRRRPGLNLTPQHLQMFVMACYNTERFRDFIFKSGFLNKFEVEPHVARSIESDDEALLEFSFRWLDFALFQKPSLRVKDSGDAGRT